MKARRTRPVISRVPRPLAPIKLMRMRIRTFRPDSKTIRSHYRTPDVNVYITLARIDALQEAKP